MMDADRLRSGHVTEDEPSVRTSHTLVSAANATCKWVLSALTAGRDFLFAPEPWQLGTLDIPASMTRRAVDRSAAIAAFRTAAHVASRLYRAVVMETTGASERVFTFEDSPTLFDGPVDVIAKTILGHIASSDRPESPLRYSVVKARWHGDLVMVDGALLVRGGILKFIVLASAD
jgi:hypothetical protein